MSKEFCRSALEQIDWATAETATINDQNPVVDPSYRRTDVIWQSAMQPLGCVARTYIEVANQNSGWNYVLSGQENTQLTRYKSTDEGFYDWHMDAGIPKDGIQRKLSCILLLSDPADFEGGELILKGINGEKNMLTKQGSIVVFPSFMDHKVTPVTKGVRHTAVTWAIGPSFK